MRITLFLLFIILFCKFCYSQTPFIEEQRKRSWKENLHYEVTIFNSSGSSYYNKIKIQKEGLLISKFCRKKSKWKIKFFKPKELYKHLELGSLTVDILFFHIKDEKIMEMTDLLEPEFKVISYTDDNGNEIIDTIPYGAMHKSYMIIQINDLVEGKSLYLKYGIYDERIDKLIDMMNELIPKKYRKTYAIRKWIHGTSKE